MKKSNVKLNIALTLIASLLIGFVCFAVLILSYTLVNENVNNKEGIFFLGYKPIVIISESMEPVMKVNGVSVLKQENNISNIVTGDIIMFNTESHGLVMHRVIDKDEYGLITKGDNNLYPDTWRVTNSDLKGKVVKTYNFVADCITFLFGNLVNINTKHLIFGFVVLTGILVALIVILNTCYENIKTLIDVLRYGLSALMDDSDYLENKIDAVELDKILDLRGCRLDTLSKIKLFYYTLLLRDRFKKDEDNAKHTRKIYNKVSKVIDKIENKK